MSSQQKIVLNTLFYRDPISYENSFTFNLKQDYKMLYYESDYGCVNNGSKVSPNQLIMFYNKDI